MIMVKVNQNLGYIFILGVVFLYSCFPKERQIDFNKDTMEISLCESGTITRIIIYGKPIGSDEQMNKISEITALGQGSEKFSLIKYNEGYDSVIAIEKILPNYQYQIDIPYLDNQSEIIFYTDSFGKIDNVVNPYSCK